MKLSTLTVIGRDKTGVIARITSFLFEQKANIEGLEEHVTRGQFSMNLDEGPIIAQDCFHVRPHTTLKEIIATGQRLEARTLLEAIKLYLVNRLDVYWAVVKEI